jgi:hypothetical protein
VERSPRDRFVGEMVVEVERRLLLRRGVRHGGIPWLPAFPLRLRRHLAM